MFFQDAAGAGDAGAEPGAGAPGAVADAEGAVVVVDEPSKVEELNHLTERIMHGDFGRDTWVEAWVVLGQPLLLAIVLILTVLFLSRWAGGLVTRALRRARVEETLARFFGNAARWGVLVLGGLAVLNTFGVDTTSFAAAVAAVGFAIGMALSGTLGHFAAGVMLLIFRPFKVGDVVRAAGVFGKINEVGMFTTSFDTFQNARIIVPNGKIYGDIIENVTHHQVRRQDVPIGASYSADIDETRRVLERVVAACEGALADPAPQVFLEGLGDSSVNWQLRVWAKAEDLWPMRERLIRDAKKALESAGIGIPFPQRDVHLSGPVEVRMVDTRKE